MQSFTLHEGIAAPLLRPNIDTDAIIPSREMKKVSRQGLAEGLFANWRYRDVLARCENPDFILNQEPFRRATILLAGINFGCGSSREHAVWALREFGFRAIVAPSFGSIFFGNCIGNGVLPVRLAEGVIEQLANAQLEDPTRTLAIDLPAQTLRRSDHECWSFEIDQSAKHLLIEGLDPIEASARYDCAIAQFMARDRELRPWIYPPDQVSRRP